MKKIVTVGGGTGSFTVLSGLKTIPNISITAVVSMADDGGSTGVLRDQLGVLPPGDVRQCLVALSEHSDVVRELMNYRFSDGALSGHSFGNIFLAALEKVTGNFKDGVEVASEILKVNGAVVPVTNNKAILSIVLKDKSTVEGEDKINNTDLQKVGIEDMHYNGGVALNESAEKALLEADYIILGPGNYYCSVLPNLIVKGFTEAILSSKAKIILPINLTNKQGHTQNWNVSDYVADIERYLNKKVDIILINNEPPTKEQIDIYNLKEGSGISVQDDMNDGRIIREPMLSSLTHEQTKEDVIPAVRGFIRHDSMKLAKCINNLINNN